MNPLLLTHRGRRIDRRFRQARMLTKAFKFRYQPINAHIIPTRRCNLACTYCNEYDDYSQPIPAAEMCRRVDQLAALGTGIVTLSGGEPLLHPELDDIIRHVRRRGTIATLITNGYLLTIDRIKRLNRAGLDHLQISIDNVMPDDVSKKSLKVLDQKLEWLARFAAFDVTVNAVVGSGIRQADDALVIARRAVALDLSVTVGIIHDHSGQLMLLDAEQRDVFEEIGRLRGSTFDVASYDRFQRNLSNGQPNEWQCRAGSRYLYVCEDGLVHWCSQQRGYPGVPLEQYDATDLEREHASVKPCAPLCTVGCVHRVAQFDELREHPVETLTAWFSQAPGQTLHTPLSVRFLTWMFITSPQRHLFRSAAQRLFGA